MRGFGLLLLFIYLYLEISLFVAVADSIGVFLTLLALIATSVIGLSLMKSQGIKNLMQIRTKLAQGQSPLVEMFTGSSILLAGILLLLPGFLTDIIGAILLLPLVQQKLAHKAVNKAQQAQAAAGQHDDIIDGTFTRKDD